MLHTTRKPTFSGALSQCNIVYICYRHGFSVTAVAVSAAYFPTLNTFIVQREMNQSSVQQVSFAFLCRALHAIAQQSLVQWVLILWGVLSIPESISTSSQLKPTWKCLHMAHLQPVVLSKVPGDGSRPKKILRLIIFPNHVMNMLTLSLLNGIWRRSS